MKRVILAWQRFILVQVSLKCTPMVIDQWYQFAYIVLSQCLFSPQKPSCNTQGQRCTLVKPTTYSSKQPHKISSLRKWIGKILYFCVKLIILHLSHKIKVEDSYFEVSQGLSWVMSLSCRGPFKPFFASYSQIPPGLLGQSSQKN
jgi:hypothetical protein